MKNQRGYTLIELMIGLLVGLIVLSAVIYSFLVTLRSSRDVVNSSLVTNEVALGADIISGELRRAGFSEDSSLVPTTDIVLIASGSSISNTGNCVFYVYDIDGTAGLSTENYRAFRSSNGRLQYANSVSTAIVPAACDYSETASPWESLSDNRIFVTDLEFTLVSAAVGSADILRVVNFEIGAAVVSDTAWKASSSKAVEVRNHYE